jgi:carbamoyltransferase
MEDIVVGISAYYHDSAACIIKNGEIVAAAQEERFTRKKHDSSFPSNALKYVLSELDVDPSLISHVAFYDKPLLKFERLLETYHAFMPDGIQSFFQSIPVWLREKLHIRQTIKKELEKYGLENVTLLFPEHHLSHAASAFYPSPFTEAAILTIDGVGEWSTTTIGFGKGNTIKLFKELHFPHSLGLLYSAFTWYCGFRVNSGEYKLMGLAPYGQPESKETENFKAKITDELIDVRPDGSFLLNMKYFNYATGLRMTNNKRWKKLFGIPPRRPESEIGQGYCNLALAVQQVTEHIVLQLAKTAGDLTGSKNLVMAGGVALNSVANGKLQRSGLFENIWIQPAAGDAGGALGAALAARYLSLNKVRVPAENNADSMQGALLGPSFSDREIFKTLTKYRAAGECFGNFDELCHQVALLLAEGKTVGWFQDRMEFGPRALGNRSILADPRRNEMQKKLNLQIKFREGFRPFAPAVLNEFSKDYFDLDTGSPYMMLVCPVQNNRKKKLPGNYMQLPLLEKLYFERSDIPAVTHIDYSARIQTVHQETNPKFHQLIHHFNNITGCPVLINTSFNVRGEPIVCTPENAFVCFMRTDMDFLVMGNYLLNKTEQNQVKELPKFNYVSGLD